MHEKSAAIQDRVTRMLTERIRPLVHRPVGDLHVEAWHVGAGVGEPVPAGEAFAADYRPFRGG